MADAPGGGDDSGGSSGDAPATGDGPPVGGQGCAGLSGVTLFCDDFEHETAGQPPQGAFQVSTAGGGTMTVETSKPYSGAQSVHIHVPTGSGGGTDPTAQMHFTQQFPVAGDDVHGRVMMYLTKNPNGMNNPNIHWDLTWSSAAGGIQYVLGSMWNPTANAGAFMPVYQPPDDSIDTSTPWPEAKWACIQWEFRHGGSGGDLLQIKMNGNVVDLGSKTASGLPISGGNIPGWPAGSWTDLVFGYVHYSSATPIDVDIWFDDLAFGAQDIPCPPLHP